MNVFLHENFIFSGFHSGDALYSKNLILQYLSKKIRYLRLPRSIGMKKTLLTIAFVLLVVSIASAAGSAENSGVTPATRVDGVVETIETADTGLVTVTIADEDGTVYCPASAWMCGFSDRGFTWEPTAYISGASPADEVSTLSTGKASNSLRLRFTRPAFSGPTAVRASRASG
jgi:hypothetical protein